MSIVCDDFRFCELKILCFELKILLRKLFNVLENDFECSRDFRDSAISFLSEIINFFRVLDSEIIRLFNYHFPLSF